MLGGSDSPLAKGSARSSRASSITLKKKLRKLDRKISLLDRELDSWFISNTRTRKVKEMREKADNQRREVRNKLKHP